MLFALRALRHVRRLHQIPIRVLYYADEGRDCPYSEETISKAAARARNVLVLRPGNEGNYLVTVRRGQRRIRVVFAGEPQRLGRTAGKLPVLPWVLERLLECSALSSKQDRIAVATEDIRVAHLPMLLPHEVTANLVLTYPNERSGNATESRIREILTGNGVRSQMERLSDRPAMTEHRANARLAKALYAVADKWDFPLKRESSVWPSAAGLVPASTGVVCGIGPVAKSLYRPEGAVDRISLMQRTLLLAEFLLTQEQG